MQHCLVYIYICSGGDTSLSFEIVSSNNLSLVEAQ